MSDEMSGEGAAEAGSEPVPDAVQCSRCGEPVLVTEELAQAFSRIPERATVRLLCPACSQLPRSNRDVPPAQTRAERVFRVSLLLSELAEVNEVVGGIDDGKEVEEWEDIGGFSLRGSGGSVRAFVDQQAGEFSRRMEAILGLADVAVNVGPESEPEPPAADPPE